MTKAATPAPPPTMPTPVGDSPPEPSFRPGEARHPGRPSNLNRDVERVFMTALRNGSSISASARIAGLRPKTVEEWLQRGRGADRDRPATPEYIRFARLASQNRAAAEVYVVGNLVARTRVDTRAAEVWLRAHGGPEWRDEGALVPPPGAEGPVVPTLNIDNREQSVNVLVLSPEEVPDVVRGLLAKKRATRIDIPVTDAEETPHHGPTGTRTAGLREDG